MSQVFIGLGSSVNKQESIGKAIDLLTLQFGKLSLSSVFESEAVGFEGDTFYNLVAEFNSNLSIEELIHTLKEIEIKLGRPTDAIKLAPRTIDIDLLLYEQQVYEALNVPRGEITENAFVLQPLAELAPDLTHPLLGVSYKQLWEQYPKHKQKLWKIDIAL